MYKKEKQKKHEYSKLNLKRNKTNRDAEEKLPPPEKQPPSIPYYKLFKYSTTFDKILIFFSVIFCLISSAANAAMNLTFGEATGSIVSYVFTYETNGTTPGVLDQAVETLKDEMHWMVVVNCILGAIILLSTYLATVMLNYSALKQTFKIRELFFFKVLNQDIPWYDQNQTGDFSSRIADVCESLLTGSWSLANALAFAPNFSKGLIGADRIFQLIHRTPKILNGFQDAEKWEAGNLTYRNVCFSYPNRPTVEVLADLNLSVLKGKMVALVGPSGCGKSTIVQLLERFYDPTSGEISADGTDCIRKLKLHALRFQFGMVSQEPNLFSKTIAENIAYGDNNRTVAMVEIISAAKQANIHNFIISLPLGYQTKLGEKGTQLSGGQKQRVAIARALVRNPKVLLLDEATSALDAESEKIVQDALDNAKIGRTCITIAHRLTTIQTADLICVVNHGRITEMGTHSELLSRKGLYYNLYSLQTHK